VGASIEIGYTCFVVLHAQRRWASPIGGLLALAVIGGICLAVSSPEAKRDARVRELIRGGCEKSRLSHVSLARLVRLNRDAAVNQDHAVRTLVAFCQASR